MMTMRTILAAAGCMAMCTSHAGSDIGFHGNAIQATNAEPEIDRVAVAAGASDLVASYRLSSNSGTLSGSFGLHGETALGIPALAKRYIGTEDFDPAIASRWLDSPYRTSTIFTLGYAWRDVRVEGSAFATGNLDEHRLPRNDTPKLDARAARLSFNPSERWLFQFSRGTLSGLDQIVGGTDLRRSALSMTYQNPFENGNWQTTLAWGRNTRQFQAPTTGYLLESTLRFSGTHILFGRMEQVSSDDLLVKDRNSMLGLPFKVNKLTFGYFRDLPSNGLVKLDAGIMGSRHLVPAHIAPVYGQEPTSVMLILRFNFR